MATQVPDNLVLGQTHDSMPFQLVVLPGHTKQTLLKQNLFSQTSLIMFKLGVPVATHSCPPPALSSVHYTNCNLIKLLSFFLSDKCELRAGSDEKNTAPPRRGSNSSLPTSEDPYLIGKKCTKTLWVSKAIAAHEKQHIMQEEAQTCVSWWRKTPRPKRVCILAIDASIVDCVCLSLKHLIVLPFMHSLSLQAFVKKKRKEKCDKWILVLHRHESAVYRLPRSTATSIHPSLQHAKVTLLEISPCLCPILKRSGVAYSLFFVAYAILATVTALPYRRRKATTFPYKCTKSLFFWTQSRLWQPLPKNTDTKRAVSLNTW